MTPYVPTEPLSPGTAGFRIAGAVYEGNVRKIALHQTANNESGLSVGGGAQDSVLAGASGHYLGDDSVMLPNISQTKASKPNARTHSYPTVSSQSTI
jgi:hypothetical protein